MSVLDLDPADYPVDVVDRPLWRDAQLIFQRHGVLTHTGQCGGCGRPWPCRPRLLAERVDAAARAPWRQTWTERNDLASIGPGSNLAYTGRGRRDDP